MNATRNHLPFSAKHVQVFVLQDNKGFHVFLRHPLTNMVEVQHEESKNLTPAAETFEKIAFSAMTSKAQDKIVTFCKTNTLLDGQRSSLVTTRLRRNQSPSLTAARTINYYLSTGILHISEQNVLPILEISLRLGLIIVQEACTLLLSKTLTIRSWNEVLRLARDYHSRSLTNIFTKLTRQHITKCLARNDLVSLIGSLTHSKANRQSLKFFLKRFVNGGMKKNMIQNMFDLFDSEAKMLQVCFKDYLESYNKLAIQDVDASKLNTAEKQIEEVMVHTKLNAPSQQKRETKRNTSQPQAKERKEEKLLPKQPDKNSVKFIPSYHSSTAQLSDNTFLLICGGITNEQKPEPTNIVFLFISSKRRWMKLPSMNSKRYNHSIVSMGHNVIAIGGNTASRNIRDNNMKANSRTNKSKKDISVSDPLYRRNLLEPTQTNSVEQLSIKDGVNEWSTVYSMILAREEHSTVVVGEQVYTIGGHDGICQLCSVERYNPVSNLWSLEKPMSRLRTGASAVTDGRNIYIIGGYGGLQWLNTIDCYDTITKTWSRDYFPPMTERRGYACAEMLHNDIFVFGGTNKYENLKTCEVFNIKAREWRKGPSMSEPRLNAAHCVFNGRILVLGGECNGRFLDTVEQLDTEAWEWKPFCKLPGKLAGLKCTVVTR